MLSPMRIATLWWTVLLVLLWAGAARGDRSRADLERQLDAQRAALEDLGTLDTGRMAGDELALFRSWLDEAHNRLREKKPDLVRELVDRMLAQGQLIRQLIAAGTAADALARKEAELADARRRVQELAKAIDAARVKQKALEMKTR
jgi:hypothetical protein